jgi:hypothetical protein
MLQDLTPSGKATRTQLMLEPFLICQNDASNQTLLVNTLWCKITQMLSRFDPFWKTDKDTINAGTFSHLSQ